MPAKTPCIKCGVVGFVRWEHILTGGRAVIEYYCGHCQHSWTVDNTDPRNNTTKPDRKSDSRREG